jgi:NADPH:quinone reductase-like Zn-dependent oxidoreductase
VGQEISTTEAIVHGGVATTASTHGEALVKRLGADVVIDYQREHFKV